MSAEHHFHVAAAVEVGVNAAIILEQFDFWITKNRANNRHYYDGRYWTYNSNKAFAQMYPYLSPKLIRTALKRLEDGGYVVVGDYNEDRMVRPKWYSITDKGYELLYGQQFPNGYNELPHGANRAAPEGNSHIYNSYSFNNSSSSINKGESAQKDNTEAIKVIIDHLNRVLGTSYTCRNKETNKHINARLVEGYTVEDFKLVIDTKAADWTGTEWEKYLRPNTLFSPSHFEEYLNQGRMNACGNSKKAYMNEYVEGLDEEYRGGEIVA